VHPQGPHRFGSGYAADVLVVAGDLSQDASVLANTRDVLARGVRVKPD
jgi:hypothetical protein